MMVEFNQLQIPARLKVSSNCRTVRQSILPHQTDYVLVHTLSGLALKVSHPTFQFISNLKSEKNISRGRLLRQLEPESAPSLKLLLGEKFLLNEEMADEFDLFLDHFPIVIPGTLWVENADGTLTLVLSIPNPIIEEDSKVIEIRLDRLESDFFLLCDGKSRMRDLFQTFSKMHGLNLAEARGVIQNVLQTKLNRSAFQIIRLSSDSIGKSKASLGISLFSPASVTDIRHTDEVSRRKRKESLGTTVDLAEFHQSEIKDAMHQFDKVEVTVSHAFRSSSSALGNRTYGGAFFDRVVEKGFLDKGQRILEVGGGTGYFSQGFLNRAYESRPDVAPQIEYQIADIAPVLIDHQRELNKNYSDQMSWTLMNAEKLALPAQSVDLILSNEVIADFRSVRIQKKDLLKKQRRTLMSEPYRLALDLIQKYNLDFSDAPKEVYLNLGAVLFLERIAKVLAPGGAAVITEFGEIADYPAGTHHLNHDEYSIQWCMLIQVAKRLKFRKIELFDLETFLRFNPYEQMFAGDLDALSHVLKPSGVSLEIRAYTRSEIEDLLRKAGRSDIRGLQYESFSKGSYFGPSASEFKTLILQN